MGIRELLRNKVKIRCGYRTRIIPMLNSKVTFFVHVVSDGKKTEKSGTANIVYSAVNMYMTTFVNLYICRHR